MKNGKNFRKAVEQVEEKPYKLSAAMELLKKGWIDFLSSDFHARGGLKPYIRESREALSDVGADEQFRMLTSTNPARMLADEEPLPVQPLFEVPGLWNKVKRLLRGRGRGA